jgi:ATP-binding cassette, subfamily B, bacterial PglK
MLNKLLKIFPKLKSQIIPYSLYTLLASFLDLIGISVIALFASLLLSPEQFDKNFLANFIFNDKENLEIYLSFLIILIFFIKGLLIFKFNKKVVFFCFDRQHYLRSEIVKKIFFSTLPKNINNFKDNFTLLFENLRILTEDFLINFIRFISDTIILVIILIYLLYLNFYTTFSLLIVLSLGYFLYKLVLKKIFVNLSKIRLNSYKSLVSIFDYVLLCFKEISFYQKEDEFLKYINSKSDTFITSSAKQNALSIIPKYFIEFILVLFLIIASLILSIRSGEDSFIFELSIYAAAAARIAPLGSNILNSFSIYWKSKVALDDYLNFEKNNFFSSHNINNQICYIKNFETLEIENLNFSYGERKILDNLCLKISKNKIIGIYGRSGVGKSTLVNLLLNFEKNFYGKIYLNEKKQINFSKFSSLVSYIPQDIILMDRSILNNITLSLSNDYDQKKLERSLQLSNLKDVVKIKGSINYMVGHHGNNLSGGEKQRVSIARALYFEKKFLILDEPTSGLDIKNEKEFMLNLRKLSSDLTVIIVSHSNEIKKYCDEIYNLSNGKLILNKK